MVICNEALVWKWFKFHTQLKLCSYIYIWIKDLLLYGTDQIQVKCILCVRLCVCVQTCNLIGHCVQTRSPYKSHMHTYMMYVRINLHFRKSLLAKGPLHLGKMIYRAWIWQLKTGDISPFLVQYSIVLYRDTQAGLKNFCIASLFEYLLASIYPDKGK